MKTIHQLDQKEETNSSDKQIELATFLINT